METIYSDVTVVGGGIAGMCAAIAAARRGLQVVLINDRPVLGGNASSEITVRINGAASNGQSPSVYARESGIVEELKLTLKNYNPGQFTPGQRDAAYFGLIYDEPNIALYLNTVVHDAKVEDGRITSVSALQLRSEREFEFVSPLFIDCSGDGIAGAKAGAPFMIGHEGKATFGESLAPDEYEDYVMGNTMLFTSRDAGRKVEYRRPAFAHDITKMEFFKSLGNKHLHRTIVKRGKVYSGYWWMEYGGHLDTVKDDQEITLELRKLVYGLWDYIKNSGEFEDVDNLELDFIAPIPGKRESRRFVGDYILNQNDIDNQTVFPDAVCFGGWPMDVHASKGIYDPAPATNWFPVKGIYGIPFRSLYSQSVDNLMFAGRNISASHVAMGSTRVMATCGSMGQAVGTAAYLCKKYGVNPRDVSGAHMQELQDLLQRDDQGIIGRREAAEAELLQDLAVTASSVKFYENTRADGTLQLNKDLLLALPVATEYVESAEVRVKNNAAEARTLRYAVWGGGRLENYTPEIKLADREVAIPGGFDGWLTLPIHVDRPDDYKVYLLFKSQDDLELYATGDKLTGVVTFEYHERSDQLTDVGYLRLLRLNDNVCFRHVLPQQTIYAAANVVNGFARPYGLPHLWISEPVADEQQEWIEFAYSKPKRIKEIHLVFNSMLEEDNFYQIQAAAMPTLIKDYAVEIVDSQGREQRIEIEGNFLRLRKHQVELEDVVNIRYVFKSTHGAPCYEVYAIKLYGETQA